MSGEVKCPIRTDGFSWCSGTACGLAGDKDGNCLIKQALQIYIDKNRPIDISKFAEDMLQSVKPIHFDEKYPHGGCYEDLSDLRIKFNPSTIDNNII